MKGAYIHTFGCQMNVYDSRKMAEIMTRAGYRMVGTLQEADVILVNTCAVRTNPENKVYSLLGRISRLKKRNPDLIVGVAGCVAQLQGEAILRRHKAVDLVLGTDSVFLLPQLLADVGRGKRRVMIDWLPRRQKVQNFIPDEALESECIEGCRASIAITKGCDHHCAFCIVPATRGRMVSREMNNILTEIRHLLSQGMREILLLGQNVNAYRVGATGFYELLTAIAEMPGLRRLRFTSPHPNDWDDRLTQLMADHPVICRQIHLPLQAGSDRILQAMRRGHTAADFLAKVAVLKEWMPDIAISTDIIVGFPGESEADFEQTLGVLKTVRFSQAYAFMYSERPGTRAVDFDGQVPLSVREDRLQRLLAVQQPIQSALLDEQIGTCQEVLIDSVHPREPGVMNGRNPGNVPVSIADRASAIGDLVQVRIIGRRKHSLIGALVGA
jgi:tRNA-2-methylthio-N6-dimethylallyladenosine synthase